MMNVGFYHETIALEFKKPFCTYYSLASPHLPLFSLESYPLLAPVPMGQVPVQALCDWPRSASLIPTIHTSFLVCTKPSLLPFPLPAMPFPQPLSPLGGHLHVKTDLVGLRWLLWAEVVRLAS